MFNNINIIRKDKIILSEVQALTSFNSEVMMTIVGDTAGPVTSLRRVQSRLCARPSPGMELEATISILAVVACPETERLSRVRPVTA